MLYKDYYQSPIGKMTMATDGKRLKALWLTDQEYIKYIDNEVSREGMNFPIFDETRAWLDAYFNGKQPDIRDLNLDPDGTDFRQRIWRLLMEIPYGEVTTYKDLGQAVAKELGKSTMSAQAVGGAVGANPISFIIPCHRVIGSDGSLTGYAGGSEAKIWLLEHEGFRIEETSKSKDNKWRQQVVK